MLFRNASEIQNDRVIIFFLWAARLPPVAVGLYALLRFARAAPIPAAAGTRNCIGIFQAAAGVRASVPAGCGLMALPAAIFLRPFRARIGTLSRQITRRS